MLSTPSIREFLLQAHVAYTIEAHSPAFTAQEDAAVTHTPGREWAKVVVCFVDGLPIQAVVPAPQTVNLNRLLELARGAEIRLAQKDELQRLFPECEPGTMPPLGPLYGQSVYVDVALAAETDIVFNAGTNTEAIRMRWSDFAASVRPIVGKFAEPPPDHVGEFRLSYRE